MNLVTGGNTTTGETPTFIHKSKQAATTRRKEITLPTFSISTMNESFVEAEKNVANMKTLFGDLITEGDLNIFFGRSNTGKSFFAYQIAQAIAEGQNVLDVLTPNQLSNTTTKYFNLTNETQAQKVLYFDFEGTQERNYLRYTTKGERKACDFSKNLFVGYPNKLSIIDNLLFVDVMEAQTIATGAKVVIIDNLSAISQDNEKAGNAVKLLNKIKDFQRNNKLTVILIAHTPKIEEGKNISENDLAGSKQLYNLVDSVIAINTTSQDTSIRYIKQLKTRCSEIMFNTDNVITMKFCVRADGYKGYDFLAYESEHELIKIIEKTQKDEENEDIINEVNCFGSSYMDIAKKLQPKYAPGIDIKTYRERIIKRIKALKAKGLIKDTSEASQPAKPASEPIKSQPINLIEPIQPIQPLKPATSQPMKPATSEPVKPQASQPEKNEMSEVLNIEFIELLEPENIQSESQMEMKKILDEMRKTQAI
jgi:RecA-family ATPase